MTSVLAIRDIEPPRRGPGVTELDAKRATSIAEGIAAGHQMPPVLVTKSAGASSKYPYALYDGFHRFYLSLAAGFELVPVQVVEINSLAAIKALEL